MHIIIFQKGKIKIEGAIVKYYIYRLTQEGAATETMRCDSDDLPVASHWLLPAQEFHYMWESLYYDCDIKNNVGKFSIQICIYNSIYKIIFFGYTVKVT